MPHRATPGPGNLRANRIRDPRSKQQFRGRRNLGKRHHLIPNFLRRRIHLNRRPHFKGLGLQLRPVFHALERRREQENNRQHCRSAFVQPISCLDRVPQHAPKGPERQRERRRHHHTHHPPPPPHPPPRPHHPPPPPPHS